MGVLLTSRKRELLQLLHKNDGWIELADSLKTASIYSADDRYAIIATMRINTLIDLRRDGLISRIHSGMYQISDKGREAASTGSYERES